MLIKMVGLGISSPAYFNSASATRAPMQALKKILLSTS
ncbi:hypothetical protein QE380_001880 [Acinetobacter baylyi]|uniref:Uncharacterized protein n=1 Tax=Acinetobacter baylyi TaxID=202950 RepID=A0ABU0UWN3_ACIBI|nr:hypothetical protein [Acinetobacter baylyi]MDR6107449.1 hypothetical protein [Acinetobacter baylyi]MDR6185831.1 hypothetical protein [Acinetobacter baylyi]